MTLPQRPEGETPFTHAMTVLLFSLAVCLGWIVVIHGGI